MVLENITDPRGSKTDSNGVPYVESLTHTPEVRKLQEPIPKQQKQPSRLLPFQKSGI